MSEVRLELVPEFKGDTVVLMAMDKSGLDDFRAAVAQAIHKAHGSLQVMIAEVTHVFAIEGGKTDIELKQRHVTWRFSPSKLTEVLEKLDAMKASPGPCHHYVDILSPAETLVLSRDEYV
jgi:hypothetical protein